MEQLGIGIIMSPFGVIAIGCFYRIFIFKFGEGDACREAMLSASTKETT